MQEMNIIAFAVIQNHEGPTGDFALKASLLTSC